MKRNGLALIGGLLATSVLCASSDQIQGGEPVKVFIMMGQSNMLGLGGVNGGTDGDLDYAVNTEGLYPYLSNGMGGFATRTDVRQTMVQGSGGATATTSLLVNNFLSPSNRSQLGPEHGIGEMLGNTIDAPVLLLKSCIGNRSLGWDLLPPGSEQYDFGGNTYAGYGDTTLKWPTGTTPTPVNWQAGLQYDGDIARARHVLDNIGTYYPGETEYEIAGFFWWQGDKDRYDAGHATRYEQNLVQLIEQLRVEFDAPNAPFIAATLGQTQIGDGGNDGAILDAQLAVDGDAGNYSLYSGNVKTVYSNPLSLGGASNSHYNGNAKTYMNIGEAMGQAMVELLTNRAYVEVDRQTGEVKIIVPSTAASDLDLRNYTISSPGGALDNTAWSSIAGNYDGGGTTSVDSGNWSIDTSSITELSESAIAGGADGLIGINTEVSLGNIWIKSPIEDFEFLYTDTSNLPRALTVRYTGDRAGLGDLDFDGSVDANDFALFMAGAQADLTALSVAQQYNKGDLDGDGDNDIYDFDIFRLAFEADNAGPGAFAAMVAAYGAVPEPGSLALLIPGGLMLALRRRR